MGLNIIKGVEGNNKISELITSGKPFIATKMGGVEQNIMMLYINKMNFDPIRNMASANAGITPPDDYTLTVFSQLYAEALSNVDIMGSMGMSSEEEIINKFANNPIFSELRLLEPFYFDTPWSQALKGKRVLVIHPFEETIINQFKKKDLLFSNKDILPDFELLTIKAEQTNGGGLPDSKPFLESLTIMGDKIQTLDFDIAIIGCGAYGLLLANYSKKIGKQAIHIGGGLQILFGIKGKRWDVHPEISALYNEHWVRPLEKEKTINFQVIEGGTYW